MRLSPSWWPGRYILGACFEELDITTVQKLGARDDTKVDTAFKKAHCC